MSTKVVFDINVLICAIAATQVQTWDPAYVDVMKNQKTSGTFSRMALFAIEKSAKTDKAYSLVSDNHIRTHVQRFLTRDLSENGYGWNMEAANDFLKWSAELAESSNGEACHLNSDTFTNHELNFFVPDAKWLEVGAEVDHEDRRLVALAVSSGASIIVTNDRNFLKLGESIKGISIVTPEQFSNEVFN